MTTNQAYKEFFDNACHRSMKPEISEEAKAVAMKSLQEKMERERPYPINIEELKTMENHPILFVKIIGDCNDFTHTWVLMFGYEKSNGNFLFTNSVGNQHLYSEKDYGKTWLAYKTEGEKFN